ncbi:MAG TPA: DUF2946 family protein [Burkholderiales bacterium]|nr:DUF2946 family protein [Burkholderiales bacterium]
MTSDRFRRCAVAWLALAAMALNAAWPLLANAKPAVQPEICTSGGHATGGAPALPDKGYHALHCSLCPFGAERGAALGSEAAVLPLPASAPAQVLARAETPQRQTAPCSATPPRAPPARL